MALIMDERTRSIKVTKEIVSVLKDLKEVKAIAIGGGSVIGYPDKYSDIDIYCFSTKLPNLGVRKKLLSRLELDRFKGQDSNPKFSWSIDLFFYKGKAVGVEYIEISYINKR
jgi:predicted nucleotidyltransferase